MKSLLQKKLKKDNNASTPNLLPSTHSTSCFNVEKIYKDNKIKIQFCNKLNEKLVYFFYGKPAYKVASNEEKNRSDDLLAPICFIVDTAKLPIKFIFPFDSGAYISNRYENIFQDLSKDRLKTCYLINDVNTLKKFIYNFYNNNENYISGICCVDNSWSVECAMESLIGLLTSKGNFNFDDRAKTVEIICDRDIKISKVIKAIIVPNNHIKNIYFKKFISKNPNIDVITYKTHYPLCPFLLNEAVFQKAYEYMKKENLL